MNDHVTSAAPACSSRSDVGVEGPRDEPEHHPYGDRTTKLVSTRASIPASERDSASGSAT